VIRKIFEYIAADEQRHEEALKLAVRIASGKNGG
jgi:rubrerythrin